MARELGQNIIYDSEGVAKARRTDLLVHLQTFEDGIQMARVQGNERDENLFYFQKSEIKRELDKSFPLNGKLGQQGTPKS